MSDGAGIKTPKTLADVSHLFFSDVEERRGDTVPPGDRPPEGSVPGGDTSAAREPGRWSPTRTVLVTGGASSPGKSTIAANLATALTTRGTVALFDADPRIPNARFYLGLPSWHYLSPLTDEPSPAPVTVTESGLVVADWAAGDPPVDGLNAGRLVYLDVEGAGRCGLDYAVVDAPMSRIEWISEIARSVGRFVVVAGPGLSGFEQAFGALGQLKRRAGVTGAGLVVNMVPHLNYASSFHAKLAAVALRLLSVELLYLGGVVFEPGLGAEQREHGAIVRSRPDAAVALLMREAAANALAGRGGGGLGGSEPGDAARTEVDHEREATAGRAS
jgi:MinD-like ATPase involved in chromosome partitioning or flagellar assembly